MQAGGEVAIGGGGVTAKRKPKREPNFAHIAKLIRREVSYFNGWSVSEESVDMACRTAALKILRYLARRTR